MLLTCLYRASKHPQPAKELQMQRIIRHFLGNISFENSNLQDIADRLTQNDDQDQLESELVEPHSATPTNDYSIDPLSTSTMRMLALTF